MNDDIHALSGAYAADALDDAERARFERHLANCAPCRAEVVSLSAAATELSALTELAPPPALRDRVMRDITTVRPLPPVAPVARDAAGAGGVGAGGDGAGGAAGAGAAGAAAGEGGAPGPDRVAEDSPVVRPLGERRRQHGWPRWRGLVAAAAAVVLAVGGFGIWRSLSEEASPPTVAEKVLDAADATRVEKTFPGGATATLVRSDSLARAVLVTSKMPAAPSGRVYQLWFQDDAGHMTSAGLMPPGSDQVVVLEGDAHAATGAGITVEPVGGSAQPTSDPIALFTFT